MAWNLNSDRPIYAQLVERIQTQIVSGERPCGSKLPSVRDLAAEAGVNPNTMQKAFSELERQNLVITQRTSGRFVTQDAALVDSVRKRLAKERCLLFRAQMTELGYASSELTTLIQANYEEGIL